MKPFLNYKSIQESRHESEITYQSFEVEKWVQKLGGLALEELEITHRFFKVQLRMRQRYGRYCGEILCVNDGILRRKISVEVVEFL